MATSTREQRATGMTLLDGDHLIDAFAASGGTAEILAIGETALEKSANRIHFESLDARQKLVLADALLRAVSPVASPSGLVAAIPVPAARPFPVTPVSCLLLEGIQDPGNLGALLRTAASAGLDQVLLSPGSAFAWSPKVMRAAMGAHFMLSIHENADLPRVADEFGGKVLATAPQGGVTLYEADLGGPLAWIFGAEGGGVSESLRSRASLILTVPMPGRMESLNVAATAAICLFEQVRRSAA